VFSVFVSAGLLSAQDRPQTFGVQDYTVTTITATAFTPRSSDQLWTTSGSMGRFGNPNVTSEFYTGLDLPGGAVIDFIGINTNTDTDAAFTLELVHRTKDAQLSDVGTLNNVSTAGVWDTTINAAPIGYLWNGTSGEALILKVSQAALPGLEFFGWVEVWWHRSVSPAPGTATFADVPTDHIFFQFIEALAASGITGGCGNDNFCPDSPVTRGQMATFLAKALGLHWPGAPGLAAPSHN
jgi:hypothetical protein